MVKKNSDGKSAPPKDVNAYIAAAPQEARAMLSELRKIIMAVAPQASEVISYGIPAYKHHGMVVAFGAAKKHCGLYAMSSAVLEAFEDEFKSYSTSKGTVRFPLGQPLPEHLIRKIVKARIAENEAKR